MQAALLRLNNAKSRKKNAAKLDVATYGAARCQNDFWSLWHGVHNIGWSCPEEVRCYLNRDGIMNGYYHGVDVRWWRT